MTPRPTTRDIARHAGCHYSTVSLALRNHPSISPATRHRIQAAADALGYRPDPMLAALNAYRVGRRPVCERAVLAWITNHPTRDLWRENSCQCLYFNGAESRAQERGYRLDHFWAGEPGMGGARLSDILVARGIRGVLLAPQHHPREIDLRWSEFSAVTIGRTRIAPRLHNVYHHAYRMMTQLLAETHARGYTRPALVGFREHDDRVDCNWSAAFLVHQQTLRRADRLPPLLVDAWDRRAFLDWVERRRPDVIISKLPEVVTALREAGHEVPGGIGVALHSLVRHGSDLPEASGMLKHPSQVGQMAVDLLVDMLHRDDRGVPALPQQLLLEGTWNEGSTLRPARAPAAAVPA